MERYPRPLVVGNAAVEKVYLDLSTILRNFHQNGELSGDVPAKKLGNKAPWKARIRVVEGIVTSCQILDNRDAVVNSGELALDALYKLGQCFEKLKLPDDAKLFYKEVREKYPKSSVAKDAKARLDALK